MGALYARVAGTNHPRNGIPTNVLVVPEAVPEPFGLATVGIGLTVIGLLRRRK